MQYHPVEVWKFSLTDVAIAWVFFEIWESTTKSYLGIGIIEHSSPVHYLIETNPFWNLALTKKQLKHIIRRPDNENPSVYFHIASIVIVEYSVVFPSLIGRVPELEKTVIPSGLYCYNFPEITAENIGWMSWQRISNVSVSTTDGPSDQEGRLAGVGDSLFRFIHVIR